MKNERFVLADGEQMIQRVYENELEARGAMEDAFIRERKCNWYLFKQTLNKAGEVKEQNEIARRIRSNRYA